MGIAITIVRTDSAVPVGIANAATQGSRSGSSSGPSPATEVIEATPQHPFWVVGRGWTDAADLRVGDTLLAADGSPLTVQATRTITKQVVVYNFTVDTLHTYTVGQFRTVVHNVNCVDPALLVNQTARSYATKIYNSVSNHLKPKDLEGAWKELHGIKIPDPRTPGRFYDHVGEVNDALRSLREGMTEFSMLLNGTMLSAADRAIVEQYYSAASKTVDYVEKIITKDVWTPGAKVRFP